ncbi:MAG TPA: phosphoribosylpyrophosphate synthetase [Sphingobacteriaceae bacterium]
MDYNMTTVSGVLENLRQEGYTVDFNLDETCLVCYENELKLHPDEFVVDKHFRFEGTTDPGDEAVIYAISSTKHNVKGTLVNAYGVYSNDLSNDMVRALQEKYE